MLTHQKKREPSEQISAPSSEMADLKEVGDNGEGVSVAARTTISLGRDGTPHVHELQLQGVAHVVEGVLATLVVGRAPPERRRVKVVGCSEGTALQAGPAARPPVAIQHHCNNVNTSILSDSCNVFSVLQNLPRTLSIRHTIIIYEHRCRGFLKCDQNDTPNVTYINVTPNVA